MNTMTTKRSVAIAIAGAMTIGVTSPSWAAPVPFNTVAVEAAAPNALTDVRYYRNGYRGGYYNNGGAIIGGLALGALGAAAAAQGYYRDPAYNAPYGYSGGPYGYGAPGPGYGYYDHQRSW